MTAETATTLPPPQAGKKPGLARKRLDGRTATARPKNPRPEPVALRLEGENGETIFERNIEGFGSGEELVRRMLDEKNTAAFLEFCNKCAQITGGAALSGEEVAQIRQNLAAGNSSG